MHLRAVQPAGTADVVKLDGLNGFGAPIGLAASTDELEFGSGRWLDVSHFGDEHEANWPFEGELRMPEGRTRELSFGEQDLTDLRMFVAGWAHEEALDPKAAQELVLAVHEIASNSVRHGGGGGVLRMWREQSTLLCEVQDAGQIENPVLGTIPPGPQASCSRGLWIVNQLCDRVQIRTSPAGSRVRMHKHLA